MSIPYARVEQLGPGMWVKICPVCHLQIPLGEKKDFESFTGREYAEHYQSEHVK